MIIFIINYYFHEKMTLLSGSQVLIFLVTHGFCQITSWYHNICTNGALPNLWMRPSADQKPYSQQSINQINIRLMRGMSKRRPTVVWGATE